MSFAAVDLEVAVVPCARAELVPLAAVDLEVMVVPRALAGLVPFAAVDLESRWSGVGQLNQNGVRSIARDGGSRAILGGRVACGCARLL